MLLFVSTSRDKRSANVKCAKKTRLIKKYTQETTRRRQFMLVKYRMEPTWYLGPKKYGHSTK